MNRTVISITETIPAPEPDLEITIERLKMQLDAPPSPAVLQQIIALLTQPSPVKRRRRSDAGKARNSSTQARYDAGKHEV